MSGTAAISDICKSRDTATAALGTAIDLLGNTIALTVDTGPYLDQLVKRNTDLMHQRSAIIVAATDAVLALPAVAKAAAQLKDLSGQMRTAAAALPAATNVLTGTASVLSLGQQFADVIANAQK